MSKTIRSSFLKKIISRKNISAVLTKLAVRLEAEFSVMDMDGNILASFGPDKPVIVENKDAAPINIERETVGFVKGGGEKGSVFSEVVNYMVGTEYDKRNLSSELLSKYREINLFFDFAENINIRKDFNDMAHSTTMQIGELLLNDSVMIVLKNEYTDELEVVYEFGRKRAKESKLEPMDAVIPERVVASGRAEIVNSLAADSGFAGMTEGMAGSVMCVPMKIQDRVIGAVYVVSDETIAYSSEDLKLLTVFSSQVAAFIENDRLFRNLQETFISTVHTLAETIEARDAYTGNHTKRVMDYSVAMGLQLGMPADEMETLKLSAILHDIGKIGIRDDILLKPGRLDEHEFEIIKSHPVLGEKILNNIKQLKHIIPGVKHHHERFDGKGYPDGLAGGGIDLIARIIAVADSFDAMVTDRPYRKGLSGDDAFAELRKHSGTQFDPEIVKAFIEAYPEIDRQ
jgi:HD-GYP domain-containing protein (c-di-GMP phosphodiesterase class II)